MGGERFTDPSATLNFRRKYDAAIDNFGEDLHKKPNQHSSSVLSFCLTVDRTVVKPLNGFQSLPFGESKIKRSFS